MRPPDRLVLKYYLYTATRSHGFVLPVVVEYLLDSGLSFTQVGTTEAVFMAGWSVGELPTGYVSDRIGRRNALVVSKVLTVATLLTLGFGQTFAAFIAGYTVWSLDVTFRSGAGSAWLYEVGVRAGGGGFQTGWWCFCGPVFTADGVRGLQRSVHRRHAGPVTRGPTRTCRGRIGVVRRLLRSVATVYRRTSGRGRRSEKDRHSFAVAVISTEPL